ncbi:TPA: fimbrial protein, partial [Escherichia coli]|nr:fimbrial protein [Escherichia coli]
MFNLTHTVRTVIPALALLASISSHASVTPDRT